MRKKTRSRRDSPLGRGGSSGPLQIDTLQAILIGIGLLFFLAGVGLALIGGSAGALPFVGEGGNESMSSGDPGTAGVETTTADGTTENREATTTTATTTATTTTTTTTTTEEQTAPTRDDGETDDEGTNDEGGDGKDGEREDEEGANRETATATTTTTEESNATTENTTTENTRNATTTENITNATDTTTTTEESDGIFDVGGSPDRGTGRWWPVASVDVAAAADVFAYEGHNNPA